MKHLRHGSEIIEKPDPEGWSDGGRRRIFARHGRGRISSTASWSTARERRVRCPAGMSERARCRKAARPYRHCHYPRRVPRGPWRIAVEAMHMAPNGFLHAGSIVTWPIPPAATDASRVFRRKRPDSRRSSSNPIIWVRPATAPSRPRHSPLHVGRTTQVWDAVVTHRESGQDLALFRCTQLVLYREVGVPGRQAAPAASRAAGPGSAAGEYYRGPVSSARSSAG